MTTVKVMWTDKDGYARTARVASEEVEQLVADLKTLGLHCLVVHDKETSA